MIKYKKYSLRFLLSIPFLIISIILFNYTIDPYQQYRKASFYTFSTKKARYLNAGLIKNYDYNSLIIGSSMMANFDVLEVERMLNFSRTLKPLTFGGFISEESDTINTALKYKNIKNIFMGLDIYSFSGFNIPSEKNQRFPLYLYDDNFYNDLEYLFNFQVFRYSIKLLLRKYDKEKINFQLNTLYDWHDEYKHLFSGKELLTDYSIRSADNKSVSHLYSFEILQKNFELYLLPIIKKNTNINFIFFFPPYSIFEYKLMSKHDYLLDAIKFKNYIGKNLAKYNNVKLYDFQIANHITHNLKNYKDTTHYHKRINTWMLKEISKDRYRKEFNPEKDFKFIQEIKEFCVQ